MERCLVYCLYMLLAAETHCSSCAVATSYLGSPTDACSQKGSVTPTATAKGRQVAPEARQGVMLMAQLAAALPTHAAVLLLLSIQALHLAAAS